MFAIHLSDKEVLFRMFTFKTPQVSDKERNNSIKKQGKYLNRNFKKDIQNGYLEKIPNIKYLSEKCK